MWIPELLDKSPCARTITYFFICIRFGVIPLIEFAAPLTHSFARILRKHGTSSAVLCYAVFISKAP